MLVVARQVHQYDPNCGVKAMLRKLKEQQPTWEIGAKEVRFAMKAIKDDEAAAALVAMWPSLPDEIVRRIITLAPLASLPVLSQLERRTHWSIERLASMKELKLAQDRGLVNNGCEKFKVDSILGRANDATLKDPRAPPDAPHDPLWYHGVDLYECSDEGMRAFAKALGDGAFPEARHVNIIFTNLADSTLRQLINPIRCGALPMLDEFCIEANHASDPFMIQFSDAIATGALRTLKRLNLSLNHIGNNGLKAFAGAITNGALPRLEEFQLRRNEPGEPGIQALATALSRSALPSLTKLLLCPEWHYLVRPVCEARGINWWSR